MSNRRSKNLPRLNPNQVLGLCVRTNDVIQSLDFALENKLDLMILDQSKGLQEDWVELSSSPDLTLMRDAVHYLRSIGKEEEIALVNFGGMRSGTDVAKALAYNCTASIFGTAMGIALGGEINNHSMEFKKELTDQELCEAAVKWIRGTAQETAIIARCAGKTNVHNLEPEDMRAITLAASKALSLPLASGPLKREDF